MSSMRREPLAAALRPMLVVPLLCAAAASAEPAAGIRPAVDRAIAPAGGVLMVPLTAQRPGDRWPAAIEVALADGRTVRGSVAWMTRGSDAARAASRS